MMHRVRLVRLESTHNNMRTDEIIGECIALPKEGERFIMTAPPLKTPHGHREIVTTPVLHVVRGPFCHLFKTKNSSYQLDLLK